MLELNKKMVLTDAAMATIFKLLRMQYALSHQDERDKQNIFLAGFAEVGQAQRPAERPLPDLSAASIQDETGSAPGGDSDARPDGLHQVFQSIEISAADPSREDPREQSRALDSTLDSKGSSMRILYGISGKNGPAGAHRGEENVKKVKMKMLEGVKTDRGHKLLSFDAKCLQGCDADGNGKNITSLMKAFKMACLSYRPSSVVFD